MCNDIYFDLWVFIFICEYLFWFYGFLKVMCNDIYFWIFDFKKQCVLKLLIHLNFVVNLLKKYENKEKEKMVWSS